MARIVAGVGTSHISSVGAAADNIKELDPYYKLLFDGYGPARKWINNFNPDVVILIYNAQASAFSVELINTFVLGVYHVPMSNTAAGLICYEETASRPPYATN